jgi:acyl-CoA synthetase (AMP-forming)/AMP-acid ligase II
VLGERMLVFRNRLRSLRDLLRQSAEHGDKPCLVYEGRRISYAEHTRAVASVARALAEHYGIGRGDRVAILSANNPEWLVTFWATVSLGAIAVGLNGWWAGDEVLYGLENAKPKLLVGDRKRLARVRGAGVGLPVVEIESDFEKLWHGDPAAELPDAPIDEDDPACILYTSGTTGRPRGAVNTHRGIIGLLGLNFFHGVRGMLLAAQSGARPAQPPQPPCALVTTPFFHVSGLYAGALMMLAAGAKVVLRAGRFDAVDVMRLIERERVTAWAPMGTMAYRVVTHPDVARFDLSSVTNVGSGGAPMSRELQQQIREAFPSARASLGLGYGLTECTALATICAGEDLVRHPDSVGRPLPTVQIELRDARGRPLAEGEEGEIHIRSPLVMREYWEDPEATRAAILPGRWLRTGDIGRMLDGRLYVNARARDLILRGGENVYPVEIEQRLEAHPAVEEAAVVGVDHEELGQEVKAYVVLRRGEAVDEPALVAWVSQSLAAFKVPSRWEIRREPLPRNAAGKVLKHVLTGQEPSPFIAE